MKTIFFFASLFFFTITYGQRLNENSIVKDSTGFIYPEALWKPLLMKGGHTIKPENRNDPNTAFILVRLTEEERESRLAKMPKPKASAFFRDGEKINLGKTSGIDGKNIDLKNNKGKITIVNFWFINCPPCRMEIPELNKLVEKYGNTDSLRFVAVALDDKYALRDFLKTTPFKYTIVDEGRLMADGYKIRSYPTHVVIDQDGKVYFHTTGLATNTVYWIEKSIKELLLKDKLVALNK